MSNTKDAPAANGTPAPSRCTWAQKPLYHDYHDREWGVPLHDDRLHFEYLLLDCSQAGLSWGLMLQKREGYRAAFAGFDPQAIARFTDKDVERLLGDPGIVRNRRKIEAAIVNARAFLDIQEKHGSYSKFFWDFTDGRVIQNTWRRHQDVPDTSPLSDRMTAELKKFGFRFIGSTTIYAYMQGAGMMNDHLVSCFRYAELSAKQS